MGRKPCLVVLPLWPSRQWANSILLLLLHALDGDLDGHFSIWVNGNWRMTFKFEGQDAVLVDYQDYH